MLSAAKHCLKPERVQAKPLNNITYIDRKFLTVKCPSNNTTDGDLLRVVYFLREIVGFSEIVKYEFENGKQNQRHIHVIIKKTRMPSEEELGKMSKKFKLKKLKHLQETYEPSNIDWNPESEEEPAYRTRLIEWEVDLKKYTWHLSDIKDQEHLGALDNYIVKELTKPDYSNLFID